MDPARPIIEVDDLHKRFGSLHVLRGINLAVDRGEVVCVIGASGSGKSTGNEHLLRFLNAFLVQMKESGKLDELIEKWMTF